MLISFISFLFFLAKFLFSAQTLNYARGANAVFSDLLALTEAAVQELELDDEVLVPDGLLRGLHVDLARSWPEGGTSV